MKKIAGFLAVLTAAAALAVPAMARDRDDYNCAPYNSYGSYGAYNTYNGYNGYNGYQAYNGYGGYGTYGYPETGSYNAVRRDGHDRNFSRDRGRYGNEHRDSGYSRGDNWRR